MVPSTLGERRKMIAAIRPTELKDLPALANFLARVYKFDSSDHHVNTKLLEWKYLCPRPGWKGSRSYLLEKNGQIAAHCGVCPATFNLPSGDAVESLTMTDWAADPSVPGVGIMLFRKLMARAPTSFVIGGAPVTRQIVPRIGLRQVGEALTYSAWLRPLREFLVRPRTGRSTLRLLHGWTHPARDQEGVSGPWTSTRVTEFDDSLQPMLTATKRSWTSCQRTLADLNYLLQCPHLEMMAFLLQRKGQIAGYFIVAKASWEARLLDVFVDSQDTNEWKCVLGAVTKAIRYDSEVCRIRLQATLPILSQALDWNGYWCQYKEPIFLYDPSNALDGVFPIEFQLCDGDAGY